MKSGIYSPSELSRLARQAHERSGLSHAEAARKLNVAPQSYRQALTMRSGLARLRCRIVETFTKYVIEGPAYVLKRVRRGD